MSNGETTTLPGGNGTITLTPGDQTKIYQHQGRYIVATIQMPTGTVIPDGAKIDFTRGNSQKSTGFLALPGEPDWTAVPIVVNPADKTKGEARLGIRHDPADPTNTITVYAQASGTWTPVQAPTAAGPVAYTIVTTDPTVTIKDPDNALLQLPAQGQDQLAPKNNQPYTAHYTCTVVDDQGNAVPDFIVEWHEAGAESVGLFSYMVNAYTSLTDNNADALTEANGGLLTDSNQGGDYVRMVTNASGVADLYIVAKASTGMFVSGVVPLYDYTDFTPQEHPFLVCDPTHTSTVLAGQTPSVDGVKGDPPTLDFSKLKDAPNVHATVNHYTGSGTDDKVYLICNNHVVAGPYSPPDNLGTWSWKTYFPDRFCYSDSGPNAGTENVVFFVVASNGTVLVSEHDPFYGKGSIQQSNIPYGPLTMPTFNPKLLQINNSLLNSPQPIGIDIDLSDQPADAGWTPQPGDRLTATAYLSGWKSGGTVAAVGSADVTPLTLDKASGVVTLYFPSKDPFKGWDSQRVSPNTNSTCQIVYAVQPKGAPYHSLYSQVLTLILNTANKS